jgi:benzoyl-CoA reductase subunit B
MSNDTSSSAGEPRLAADKHDSIVGRGNREGNRLFRAWFDELTTAPERDQKVAYVFVMGSLAELMRAFDFSLVLPEINSLQTAVRHVSESYIAQAEDYGYASDVCGYVKADVGLQLRGGEHPMGQIPRPNIAVFTGACNTYIKWAEIWERMYHIPIFTLDVPGPRAAGQLPGRGHVDFENDLRYVAGQIDELISICEDLTGKRLDVDKLQEAMSYANIMTRHWKEVLELNKSRPAVYNAVSDGTAYLGVVNSLRGLPEGARFFEQLVEELEYKVANSIGTIHDERHRLALVGVPCYPIYRRFNEMFNERGGVFVGSSYTWFASGGWSSGFEYDLEHPLASLAEGVLVSVRASMNAMFHTDRLLAEMAEPYGIDGIVYHAIKSCRTVSAGMADSRRAVMEQADVGTLLIDSDHMDPRVVSEAQLKNRVDAFFEGLETRKLHAAPSRGAA